MGGNVIFNGISADKIIIKDQDSRDHLTGRIRLLLDLINCRLLLWTYPYSEFFAGSTVFLLDEEIPTTALLEVKSSFGDVDIQFDKTRCDEVLNWLDTITELYDFRLVGRLKSVDTIVTLWHDSVTGLNLQFDLEMVDFENQLPSEWARFSRCSDWDDLEFGIKGFAHKYIFRAITAKDLITADIQLKTKINRDKKITPIVFSPKGARVKYCYLGKNLWGEIPTKESTWIQDTESLFEIFFGGEARGNEIDLMYSYRGVVELICKYIRSEDYLSIVDGMANLLWGKGAQEVVRGDANADYDVKIAPFGYLAAKLGTWGENQSELVLEYYKNFNGLLQND